jgi:Family of unknown function (DUF6194)
VDQAAIRKHVSDTYPGVDVWVASQEDGSPELAWGDSFFIYDPDRNLEGSRRFPFATIVTKDYADFDTASDLNRPDVFRLNIGVSKETYQSLFGEDAEGRHDFTALDRLVPHPVYGRNHWVCVLNPSDATFESLQPLLAEAYDIVVKRHSRPGRGEDSSS